MHGEIRFPVTIGVDVGKVFNAMVIWSTIFSIVGCSSTTMVRTDDSAAKIYVDGEYKGKGAITISDTKIVGATSMIKIQKQGCEPQTVALSRNEELDVGALIGGLFVLIPFLWIMRYKPDHTFEYRCVPLKA
jgi:hypothetical protein